MKNIHSYNPPIYFCACSLDKTYLSDHSIRPYTSSDLISIIGFYLAVQNIHTKSPFLVEKIGKPIDFHLFQILL